VARRCVWSRNLVNEAAIARAGLQSQRKQTNMRQDSSVGIETRYGLDGPGIKSRWGAKFSAPVQIDPGTHSTSYTMGTGSFEGVNRPGRGVDHPPLSSAEVKERVQLYLYSTSGLSRPVLGCTLPFIFTFTVALTKCTVCPKMLFTFPYVSHNSDYLCAEINCSFYNVSPAFLCVKWLCRCTVRSESCCALGRIKLNGFRHVSTLVDITYNNFYKCTATFRPQICR
jgi:hypothetical protein